MRPIRYPFWKQLEANKELKRLGFKKLPNMIVERAETRKNWTRQEKRLLPMKRKIVKRQTCHSCGDGNSLTVERRRMNTSYHDDEMNFSETCIHCFFEHESYWNDMWGDYYAGRL